MSGAVSPILHHLFLICLIDPRPRDCLSNGRGGVARCGLLYLHQNNHSKRSRRDQVFRRWGVPEHHERDGEKVSGLHQPKVCALGTTARSGNDGIKQTFSFGFLCVFLKLWLKLHSSWWPVYLIQNSLRLRFSSVHKAEMKHRCLLCFGARPLSFFLFSLLLCVLPQLSCHMHDLK